MSFENIAVLGLGKIGKLAAKLLHESGFKVTGYDIHSPREKLSFPIKNTNLASQEEMASEFAQVEAVLSCLPYHLNVGVATIRLKTRLTTIRAILFAPDRKR